MTSICAQENIKYDSNDLASSDVFVKLSQHTSVEMSDFTVFVLVFLSYFLHLQSLKYHVSEMILGSQSIIQDSLAKQSISNVATKLQQSGTFDISLAKIYTTLWSEEEEKLRKGVYGPTLFNKIPTFKLMIPLLIAIVIFIVFLSLTAPVWPSQLGGENLVIIGLLTMVASLALSYFVLTVETPALLWIILVSISFATYAVVKTSNCDPNKVCLYKPEGYGDDFLDFNYLWISLAVGMFFIQKVMFSMLLSRHGSVKFARGFSFVFFLLFYVFMIATTFYSSPETKHHQHTPCTSKGTFVGQLIYWPLFLVIVFYIERGSYTFVDDNQGFIMAIATYFLSTLLFLVPILTIAGWEGNRDTSISRMTCSLRQPNISLDTPKSRCCKTQKISSSSLRTFDVHFNDLEGKDNVIGSNISMQFELFKSGQDMTSQITEQESPPMAYVLQIIRGVQGGREISNGETLYENQIAMKAGPNAFGVDEESAEYTLKITFADQSQMSFYQRFDSTTHEQSLIFLKTSTQRQRYSLPPTMPDGRSQLPTGFSTVGPDGVVRNAQGRPLMSNGSEMPIDHTIRSDNVVLNASSRPLKDTDGKNVQVVRGTPVITLDNTSETEDVVGCTGRNKPEGINLRGNLAKNEVTPGSGINPIIFTGRHSNTGAGMGTFWGFIIGTSIGGFYFGLTNAAKEDRKFGVAGFTTGILFGAIYGVVAGAPAGLISGLIVEGIRANQKPRKLRFEYLDSNNYPVARVAADDEAVRNDAGALEKVPLNKTHINAVWKVCNDRDESATSSIENGKKCEKSQNTLQFSYTPPDHCKYIADMDIDFTNYPDYEKDVKYYQLEINTNTGKSDKAYIHFKQRPDSHPIFGPEGYIYWMFFVLALIALTFIYQVTLYAFGKQESLSQTQELVTKQVYQLTSGIAEKADALRKGGYESLKEATTRPIKPDRQATKSTHRQYYLKKTGQSIATGAKAAVDLTSSVAKGFKYIAGEGTTAVGGGVQKVGDAVYEKTVKKAGNYYKGMKAVIQSPRGSTPDSPVELNNA